MDGGGNAVTLSPVDTTSPPLPRAMQRCLGWIVLTCATLGLLLSLWWLAWEEWLWQWADDLIASEFVFQALRHIGPFGPPLSLLALIAGAVLLWACSRSGVRLWTARWGVWLGIGGLLFIAALYIWAAVTTSSLRPPS